LRFIDIKTVAHQAIREVAAEKLAMLGKNHMRYRKQEHGAYDGTAN
jgi:uncharacterized protein YqeY